MLTAFLLASGCLSVSDEVLRFALLAGGDEADAEEPDDPDDEPEEERDFLYNSKNKQSSFLTRAGKFLPGWSHILYFFFEFNF